MGAPELLLVFVGIPIFLAVIASPFVAAYYGYKWWRRRHPKRDLPLAPRKRIW